MKRGGEKGWREGVTRTIAACDPKPARHSGVRLNPVSSFFVAPFRHSFGSRHACASPVMLCSSLITASHRSLSSLFLAHPALPDDPQRSTLLYRPAADEPARIPCPSSGGRHAPRWLRSVNCSRRPPRGRQARARAFSPLYPSPPKSRPVCAGARLRAREPSARRGSPAGVLRRSSCAARRR